MSWSTWYGTIFEQIRNFLIGLVSYYVFQDYYIFYSFYVYVGRRRSRGAKSRDQRCRRSLVWGLQPQRVTPARRQKPDMKSDGQGVQARA